jgi:hypothetical protein
MKTLIKILVVVAVAAAVIAVAPDVARYVRITRM